jgi:hypothetical protein
VRGNLASEDVVDFVVPGGVQSRSCAEEEIRWLMILKGKEGVLTIDADMVVSVADDIDGIGIVLSLKVSHLSRSAIGKTASQF